MNIYNHLDDWFHESQISKVLVRYLKKEGYTIEKNNCDNLRAKGPDIIAISAVGIREIIEVKGYPSEVYAIGEKQGQPKPTKPKLQAQHWFAEAIFSSFINFSNQSKDNTFIVAVAFPLMIRYQELISKVEVYFTANNIPFKVYFVDKDEDVTIDDFCIHNRIKKKL